MITDTISTISPIYDFGTRISQAVMFKQSVNTGPATMGTGSTLSQVSMPPTLLDSLEYVRVNILAMIIELAVPIAITYVLFMRTDVQ